MTITVNGFNNDISNVPPYNDQQDTEKRADKVKRMDELNVRDMFIPKALGGTAKGADVKSQKFK